jgi:hypothetical protein
MGSVFRTVQEQALQSAFSAPVYIEFQSVATSFVFNEESKLLCVLLHDVEEVGRPLFSLKPTDLVGEGKRVGSPLGRRDPSLLHL